MKRLLLLLLCLPILFAACGLQSADEEEEPFSADFTIRPPESLTDVYYEIPLSTEADEKVLSTGTTIPEGASTMRYEDLRDMMRQAMFTSVSDAAAALWTQPVRYTLEGSFTEEDSSFMNDLATDLIQITSFPGLRETTPKEANVIVHFADVPEAQFTYTKSSGGAITQGQITIPSGVPAWQREKLIAEKMFRLFGFFYPVNTPLESVLAEEGADYLTQADLILLEVVYGQMEPGMAKADCIQRFDSYFKSK